MNSFSALTGGTERAGLPESECKGNAFSPNLQTFLQKKCKNIPLTPAALPQDDLHATPTPYLYRAVAPASRPVSRCCGEENRLRLVAHRIAGKPQGGTPPVRSRRQRSPPRFAAHPSPQGGNKDGAWHGKPFFRGLPRHSAPAGPSQGGAPPRFRPLPGVFPG